MLTAHVTGSIDSDVQVTTDKVSRTLTIQGLARTRNRTPFGSLFFDLAPEEDTSRVYWFEEQLQVPKELELKPQRMSVERGSLKLLFKRNTPRPQPTQRALPRSRALSSRPLLWDMQNPFNDYSYRQQRRAPSPLDIFGRPIYPF